MIISIPTQTGAMYSFALSGDMLKLIAFVTSVLLLIVGYATVQVVTFILACTPVEFLHIVIFTMFVIGLYLVARVLLFRKQVLA